MTTKLSSLTENKSVAAGFHVPKVVLSPVMVEQHCIQSNYLQDP